MKILFVANIHKHFTAFHIPYIQYLKEQGYEVHVAANDGSTRIEEANKQFDLPINRSPYSFSNIKAIAQLRSIIKSEKYCLIHCHTAMGAVVTRLAAKPFRKTGLKVLYTAHGFHFYKNSPKLSWILYYPVEKYLSQITDGIITINKEDFELLKSRNFKNKHSYFVNGVGVKRKNFHSVTSEEKQRLRVEFGFSPHDFILVYAAEFIHRKNHKFLIETAAALKKEIPNLKIILAGRGKLFEGIKLCIKKAKLNETIFQLGFRNDVHKIFKLSDIGISVSIQEGLGLGLVEEMMCGLPLVASMDRGHKEVVGHNENGFLFGQNNHEQFQKYIVRLYNDKELYAAMSLAAVKKSERFELENCLAQMAKIYQQFLPKKNP